MAVVQVVAGEIASIVAHLMRYPAGMRRRWVVPEERQGAEVREPIVLVPGLADNVSVFRVLRRALEDCAAGPVVWFGYSPLIRDVRTAAADLAEKVEELCTITGARRVNLVGHSLGGLIARYYVQRLGGHARVRLAVTVATPHEGTAAAWLLSPLPLVRQLRPGSALLTELAEPAPGCRTPFVTFSSNADQLILPTRNARMAHPDLSVRNVHVPDAGHLTLPGHQLVVAQICDLFDPTVGEFGADGLPEERSA